MTRTDMRTGRAVIVAGLFDGRPFNAPNDLVIDGAGRIYFTDPRYFGHEPIEQPVFSVYRVDPDGAVARIFWDVAKPNGIALSPDGRTLYVADNDNGAFDPRPADRLPRRMGQHRIWAFALATDGSVTQRRVFVDFPGERGAGGLKADRDGNVWAAVQAASGMGVRAYAPDGREIARVPVPETPWNPALGGDRGRTMLYVAAGTSVYRIPVLAKPQRGGSPGGDRSAWLGRPPGGLHRSAGGAGAGAGPRAARRPRTASDGPALPAHPGPRAGRRASRRAGLGRPVGLGDPLRPRRAAEPPLFRQADARPACPRLPDRHLRPPRPRRLRQAAGTRSLPRRPRLGRRRAGGDGGGGPAPSRPLRLVARRRRGGEPHQGLRGRRGGRAALRGRAGRTRAGVRRAPENRPLLPSAASADLSTRVDGLRGFLRSCFEAQPDAEDFERMLAAQAEVPRAVLAHIPRGVPMDAEDALRSVKAPTLVTHGALDGRISPRMARFTKGLIPHARLSIYEGVGHAPFHETPERFDAELSVFVRGAARP